MTKDNTRTIPSRGSDQYPVRFPDGMRDKIKDAAKANGRSMNAEIIARLEASFAIGSDEMNEKSQSIYNLLQDEMREIRERMNDLEKKGLLRPSQGEDA